MKTTNGSWS